MFGVDNFNRDSKGIKNIMETIKSEVGGWDAPGGLGHQLNVCVELCGERDTLDADMSLNMSWM